MSTLTAEQHARIERNRLAALQRRKQHQLNVQRQNQRQIQPKFNTYTQSNFNPYKSQNKQIQTTQTTKPSRKRKYHQTTHLPLQSCTNHSHLTNTNTNSNKYNNDLKNHYQSPPKKRRKIYQNTNNNNNNNKQHSEYKPKTTNLITNYLCKHNINNTTLHNKNHKKPKKMRKKYQKKSKKQYKSKTKHIHNQKYKNKTNKSHNNRARVWTPLSRTVLFQRLSHSKFRSKFKLNIKEINIVYTKDVESHAFDFIRNRLSSAYPINDGKQTPMRGHPVFIAQHATATCCRTCLSKWHFIQMGKVLTNEQIIYMVEVILHWISIKCPQKNKLYN